MKPEEYAISISRINPSLPEEFIRFHIEQLPLRYIAAFSASEAAYHIEKISCLTRHQPCSLIITALESGKSEITIIAFDYTGVFSLIAGILSSSGFNILSGDIFTYKTTKERKRIIDRFTGSLPKGISFEQWKKQIQEEFLFTFGLLEKGTVAGITEAKKRVNELAAQALAVKKDEYAHLSPIQIKVDKSSGDLTRMTVISEDTPFFLYTLSSALTLHNVRIEYVRIRTQGSKIQDEFSFTDSNGKAVKEKGLLDKIQLSILFTKQFSYYLWRAPDPYYALLRFEELMQRSFTLKSEETWRTILTSPKILQDLARLLGTSDFLWEDFIRHQYEALLPLLIPASPAFMFSTEPEKLKEKLDSEIQKAFNIEEKKRFLNDFKNREIYLIDLDHIINAENKLLFLSGRLTGLAETVLSKALDIALDKNVSLYGIPRTAAGMPARHALMGLGKFGGAALGYASDIELLFVYSDHGTTDGPEKVSNTDFYEQTVKDLTSLIEAKRTGIFQLDLRLRPYGKGGPLACSLDAFCSYYGPEGASHSYERLALVRMRYIAGNPDFGEQLEGLRNDFIYRNEAINLKDLRDLRERQLSEKALGDSRNVKFSPGGLVDLEYSVQILQCLLGKNHPELRTSRIHVALEELAKLGVLDAGESKDLIQSYYFYRRLLNGLRMLRDSAEDLRLPAPESSEDLHLARRIGYSPDKGLSEAAVMRLEFETKSAFVRRFVEKYLGKESLPGPPSLNAADLVLSRDIPQEASREFLNSCGFNQPERAEKNLKKLAEKSGLNSHFAPLAVLAFYYLRKVADPDMALNNWERFVSGLEDPRGHCRELLDQPMKLDILLTLFSFSQFLSDLLIKNPDLFGWVTSPDLIGTPRTKKEVKNSLRTETKDLSNIKDFGAVLRKERNREILRIGTRDALGIPLPDITAELSNLAEGIVQIALDRIKTDLGRESGSLRDLAVCAFGKLGGSELNYSSDIDILFLRNRDESGEDRIYHKAAGELRNLLQDHTEEGFVYRVDLRLRPYGRAGILVPPYQTALDYYSNKASLWEIQALLKLRYLAGSRETAASFLSGVKELFLRPKKREVVLKEISGLRAKAVSQLKTGRGVDIKTGPGGIRDIEFLVQGLQLIHASECPEIIDGNTLTALRLLAENAFIPVEISEFLTETYIFLRKTEHILQLFEDLQTHTLPLGKQEQEALAIRAGMKRPEFMDRCEKEMARVHNTFIQFLAGKMFTEKSV